MVYTLRQNMTLNCIHCSQ